MSDIVDALRAHDYDLYVAHMRRMHPDTPPMTREAFFANRLEARYGRGASRCC